MHPPVSGFEMCFLQLEEGLNYMAQFLHFIHSFTFRKCSSLLLALAWLVGLGFGAAIFCYSGEYTASLMPLAATGQLSIVSLLLSTSLPFLLCAAAALLSMPRLLPVIGFFRAFSYAWVVCAVFCAFGTGGWLIRLLLLFTPTWSCVLLYWYMGHHASCLRSFSCWSLGFCLLMVGILVFLDFFHVSPLLQQLLS
jgi:hypothetical protein